MNSSHTRTTGTIVALLCVMSSGAAGAQPAPRPLSILDVPFISQSEALCGGAAAAMILRFWGERGLDAESFAHLVDRSAGGIRTDRLVDDLRARGWNATPVAGDEGLIDAELARGRPVLTLIEDRPGTFHYVVVVAATPQALVFHDPARAPFRVMEREPFSRRWAVTDRWMAVVVPAEAARSEPPPPPPVSAPTDNASCNDLMTTGIKQAQSGELEAAERNLTASLTCGGSASLRELAGLRLLQRRWPEVSELASAALAADANDAYAWQLLATSRFIQNDHDGALRAWNRNEQPHVDLVTVGGLTRTRQRVVERLMAVPPKALLTPGLYDLSARRLKELPSALGARLEFVPRASGLAELRAHVVERPVMPTDVWSYAALGLLAAARNEISLSTGSLTGGGERVTAGWRFWPGRPRVNLDVMAPARWGGLWGIDMFAERQPFSDATFPTSRRAGTRITVANWITSWARVTAHGGLDSWDGLGSFGTAAAELRLASSRDRVIVGLDGASWIGEDGFGSLAASVRLRSSSERRGLSLIAGAGGAIATSATPADLWFAGDTGTVRPSLLRAHPVVDDGMLQSERLGRGIVHASGEVRQWWAIRSVIQIGAGLFVDTLRVERRAAEAARGDVDVGGGLRLGFPGLEGVFRIDVGKGLMDGSTAVSFVYEP